VHIALDVTIDLDQSLGRNASCNLQTFLNDGSPMSAPEKHEFLQRDTEIAFYWEDDALRRSTSAQLNDLGYRTGRVLPFG
jgi:hypothetical protein